MKHQTSVEHAVVWNTLKALLLLLGDDLHNLLTVSSVRKSASFQELVQNFFRPQSENVTICTHIPYTHLSYFLISKMEWDDSVMQDRGNGSLNVSVFEFSFIILQILWSLLCFKIPWWKFKQNIFKYLNSWANFETTPLTQNSHWEVAVPDSLMD